MDQSVVSLSSVTIPLEKERKTTGIKESQSLSNSQRSSTEEKHLTDVEISYILSDLPPRVHQGLLPQLREIVCFSSTIEKLKKEIERSHERSRACPGTNVGTICAQTLGQGRTQSILSSFHQSGRAMESLGGQTQIKELLIATENIKCPGMIVPVIIPSESELQQQNQLQQQQPYQQQQNQSQPYQLQQPQQPQQQEPFSETDFLLEEVKLKNLILSKRIASSFPSYAHIYSCVYSATFYSHTWCLQLAIDSNLLSKYDLTLAEIARKIESHYIDIYCIFSPMCLLQEGICELYLCVNVQNVTSFPTCSIEDTYRYYLLTTVYNTVITTTLRGISGIVNTQYKDGVISVQGSNLYKVLQLPFVNSSKVSTNNLREIEKHLGIEAARQFLFDELKATMGDNGSIKDRYISLLVNRMTCSGRIKSVSRHGIGREVGVFAKSSFEESFDNFVKAGLNQEVETTVSGASAVALGTLAKLGTGFVDLVLPLKKREPVERSVISDKEKRRDLLLKVSKINTTPSLPLGQLNIVEREVDEPGSPLSAVSLDSAGSMGSVNYEDDLEMND